MSSSKPTSIIKKIRIRIQDTQILVRVIVRAVLHEIRWHRQHRRPT